VECISLAAAITLTQWSERTFWRKFSDGTMARSTGSGKAMLSFASIEAHLCMPLTLEDIAVLERADAGDAEAQNDLALLFLANNKPKGAIYWLEAAIKQDHAGAMYTFGRCHIEGCGMPANEDLGIMWIARAAAHQHLIAQAQMQAMRQGLMGGL
jgi:TPR repeat protein